MQLRKSLITNNAVLKLHQNNYGELVIILKTDYSLVSCKVLKSRPFSLDFFIYFLLVDQEL